MKRALLVSACVLAATAGFFAAVAFADGPAPVGTNSTDTTVASTMTATDSTSTATTTTPATTTGGTTTDLTTTTTTVATTTVVTTTVETATTTAATTTSRRRPRPAPTTTTTAVAKPPPPPPPPPLPAAIAVQTRAAPDAITVGSTLSYTATVSNTGGTSATVGLVDVLPPGVAPIAVDTDRGTCDFSSTVSCALGWLAPGQSAKVVLVVQVVREGTIENAISVVLADSTAKLDTTGAGVSITAAPAPAAVMLTKPTAAKKHKAKPTPKRKTNAKKR